MPAYEACYAQILLNIYMVYGSSRKGTFAIHFTDVLACFIVEIVTTISSPKSFMWVICASRDTSLRKYPACSVPNACFTAQVVYTCFLCAGLEYWNPTHTSRHHLLGQIRVRLRSEDTFVLILQVGLSF